MYPGYPSPKWGLSEVYLYRGYSGVAIGCPAFAELLLFVAEKSCHDGGCRHMGHTVWFLQSHRDPGCCAVLPLLSRASSASSVPLQSPGGGKSCSRGLALEEAVVVMKPQWWTRISCTLKFRKVIHKHPKTKLATGLQLAGNNCRDLSVCNQVCLARFSKLFKA